MTPQQEWERRLAVLARRMIAAKRGLAGDAGQYDEHGKDYRYDREWMLYLRAIRATLLFA